MRIHTVIIVSALCFLPATKNAVFAEPTTVKDSLIHFETDLKNPNSTGFFLSLPAYLYSRHSAFGAQAGYQFANMQVRFDMNVVNEYENGNETWFAMPSLNVFFSKDLPFKTRTYEGIAVGGESGLKNSFQGKVCFVNGIAGVELLIFERKTFFVEIGTGSGINPKEGAYNGGTVIGGGLKIYFSGKEQPGKLINSNKMQIRGEFP